MRAMASTAIFLASSSTFTGKPRENEHLKRKQEAFKKSLTRGPKLFNFEMKR